VVVVECQHNRLLCGVPYLDQQLHPFANQQSMSVVRYCNTLFVFQLVIVLHGNPPFFFISDHVMWS
jgi:hypothetical protein